MRAVLGLSASQSMKKPSNPEILGQNNIEQYTHTVVISLYFVLIRVSKAIYIFLKRIFIRDVNANEPEPKTRFF
jgi:hypothetical protein